MANSNALSESQFAELQARIMANSQPQVSAEKPAEIEQKSRPKTGRHIPNKWEVAFGEDLEMQRRVGQISWYAFEAMKLRLADNTTYSPDWVCVTAAGKLQMHEVKGFLRSTASAKFKVAAELFQFAEFFMWRKKKVSEGGGWQLMRHLNVG